MRVGIVHYGEDVATDPNYRPLRYGQIARRWVAAGHPVTRISPTFSHLRRTTRPYGIVDHTVEGRVQLVRTPSYKNTRSLRRALFLAAWVIGSAAAMRRSEREIDGFLVGHPPPGTVGLYRLLGGRRPVVLDIRDSWFCGSSLVSRLVRSLSRRELRFAHRIIALSESVAAWTDLAPDELTIVPIGVEDWPVVEPHVGTALRCVFVGSLNDHFTLADWIRSWPTQTETELDIYGAGPNASTLASLAADHPRVNFMGQLPSDEVPETLALYDIGVAPTAPGFGTNLSNKIAEYLSCGLYVLHSLSPEPTRFLDHNRLGVKTDTSNLDETLIRLRDQLDQLRGKRRERHERALAAIGWDRIASSLLDTWLETA